MKRGLTHGGPAFPYVLAEEGCQPFVHHGMSLRDWFAGQALAGGMVAIGHDKETQIVRWNDFAADCYRAADAMIAAREAE